MGAGAGALSAAVDPSIAFLAASGRGMFRAELEAAGARLRAGHDHGQGHGHGGAAGSRPATASGALSMSGSMQSLGGLGGGGSRAGSRSSVNVGVQLRQASRQGARRWR